MSDSAPGPAAGGFQRDQHGNLPLSAFSVAYELSEARYWIKFSPDRNPPPAICGELFKLGWLWDNQRESWHGADTTWPTVKALFKSCVSVERASPGSIRTPGRRESKAAKDQLRRALGPGVVVQPEEEREVAKKILEARDAAYREGAGHVKAGEVAAGVVQKFLKEKAPGKATNDGAPKATTEGPANALQAQHASAATLAKFDLSIFPTWAAENLFVKDKFSGAFIPFVLNGPQLLAFAALLKQWNEEGLIRQNWLKSRQVGWSTLIEGVFVFIAAHVPGVEALCIAHRSDASDAIFRRAKIFEQHLKSKPAELERSNKREIQWASPHFSALRVATADDSGFGRGETRTMLHASECAYWGDNGDEIMVGVLNSIPDAPGTIVIKESTANGVVGTFYRGWCDVEEKRSGYRNVFVGFLSDASCVLPTAPPEDDPQAWKGIPAEWMDDEPRLKSLGATWPQLAWRRKAIAEKCESSPEKFKQDYPATAAEAFLNSGANFFPLSVVDPELKRTSEIELLTPAKRYRLNAERTKYVEDRFGPLRIWKQPEAGHPYLVAVDTASGASVTGEAGESRLDYTTMRVIDRWTFEEVAAFHGRGDPDLLAHDAVVLATLYSRALLAIESNHSSGIVMIVRALRELKFTNLFRHENVSKGTQNPIEQDPETHHRVFGWRTGPGSGITKAIQLQHLHRLVRDRIIKIHDPEAWMQLRQFLRLPDGKLAAEKGAHDDIPMALSIASTIMAMHEMVPPQKITKKQPGFLTLPWVEKVMAKSRAKAQASQNPRSDYR